MKIIRINPPLITIQPTFVFEMDLLWYQSWNFSDTARVSLFSMWDMLKKIMNIHSCTNTHIPYNVGFSLLGGVSKSVVKFTETQCPWSRPSPSSVGIFIWSQRCQLFLDLLYLDWMSSISLLSTIARSPRPASLVCFSLCPFSLGIDRFSERYYFIFLSLAPFFYIFLIWCPVMSIWMFGLLKGAFKSWPLMV